MSGVLLFCRGVEVVVEVVGPALRTVAAYPR
jgi:hypothetical protein